jgi:hypothetical protein
LYILEIALEVLQLDDHSASAVIGVKAERLGMKEILVKEQDDMVLGVVDKTEGADTSWL